jgi:hypothetical protein
LEEVWQLINYKLIGRKLAPGFNIDLIGAQMSKSHGEFKHAGFIIEPSQVLSLVVADVVSNKVQFLPVILG